MGLEWALNEPWMSLEWPNGPWMGNATSCSVANSRVMVDKNKLKSGFGVHSVYQEQIKALKNAIALVSKMRQLVYDEKKDELDKELAQKLPILPFTHF